MKTIGSRQNPWFKRLRAAIDHHRDEIAIEGPKAVADAVASGWRPIAVVTRPDVAPPITIREHLAFPPELFEALASTQTDQGVIGLFERPVTRDLFDDTKRIIVALEGVQDPGNVGTVVRLAAAFDAAGVVILPGTADPFGPKAIRASAGAILTVPITTMTVDALLACGWSIYAADGTGKAVEPPARRAVLVFGSEGSGVSAAVKEGATRIAIPMSERVESLNVAAAAAILLSRSYQLRFRMN